MALYKLIHLLAVVIWVGGMFFAYMVLRPGIAGLFKQEERLRMWDRVFNRFFKWVWPSALLLISSGLYMIHLIGGFASLPPHIHLMLLLGLVMLLIYCYVFFVCYSRFTLLVAANDMLNADKLLATIRKLIATNLSLGLLTICVAVLGMA